MPPIIGAAMRRITSAPVPADHMMGTRPMNITPTVMTFGRSRFTAPNSMASLRFFQFQADLFDRLQVRAKHFDSDRRAHARRDHVNPGADGEEPGVGKGRDPYGAVQLRNQVFPWDPALLGPDTAQRA